MISSPSSPLPQSWATCSPKLATGGEEEEGDDEKGAEEEEEKGMKRISKMEKME